MEDLDDIVTIPEAAERMGVTQSMIRNWESKGKIHRVNPDSGTRPRFRLIDIARAERDARKKLLSGRRSIA